jgi:hypothetical protein
VERARARARRAEAGDAGTRVDAAERTVREAVERLAAHDPAPALDRLRRIADRALRTRADGDADALDEGLAAATRAIEAAPVEETRRARALGALTMTGAAWGELRDTDPGSADEGRAAGQLAGWLIRAADEVGSVRFPAPETAIALLPEILEDSGLPAKARREVDVALRAAGEARERRAAATAGAARAAREVETAERALAGAIDALRTATERRRDRRLEEPDEAGAGTARAALVVALLTVLAGIGIAVWIARTVIAPLRRAAARILAARDRDLRRAGGTNGSAPRRDRPARRPTAGRFAG